VQSASPELCKVFTVKIGEPGVRAAGETNGRHSISSQLVKYKYNCRYFLMTFRKRISKKKFSKNDFHTLQGTLFHRPLTNTSSLKITAAYCRSTRYAYTVSWWIRKLNCIEEVPRFFFSIQLKIKFKNLNWLQLNLN
jgi:hypothetical protein